MKITLKNLIMTSFVLGMASVLTFIVFIKDIIGTKMYVLVLNEFLLEKPYLPLICFMIFLMIVVIIRTLMKWTK